jgi:hypothetical protein
LVTVAQAEANRDIAKAGGLFTFEVASANALRARDLNIAHADIGEWNAQALALQTYTAQWSSAWAAFYTFEEAAVQAFTFGEVMAWETWVNADEQAAVNWMSTVASAAEDGENAIAQGVSDWVAAEAAANTHYVLTVAAGGRTWEETVATAYKTEKVSNRQNRRGGKNPGAAHCRRGAGLGANCLAGLGNPRGSSGQCQGDPRDRHCRCLR